MKLVYFYLESVPCIISHNQQKKNVCFMKARPHANIVLFTYFTFNTPIQFSVAINTRSISTIIA